MPKSSPTPPSISAYGITALEAGLQVLRAVGESPDLKVPQLATRTGLTKSKVFRILRTLETQGYVWFAEDHSVRLGSAAVILGKQAQSQFTLTDAAGPVLDHLLEETQENTYLMVREGLHSLVVDVRHSPHILRTFARVGTVAPLHAGGANKVLLAYAPANVQERVLAGPLERFTDETAHDPAELRQILEQIRRDQLHVTISDLQLGVFAIAAPVFDAAQVVAAISVAAPMTRFDDQRLARYSALIREASQAITQRLGEPIR